MDIEKAIQDFITVHEINNCSPWTIRQYTRVLKRFATWLKEACSIEDTDQLRLSHLREWVAHLKQSSNGNDVLQGRTPKPLSDTSIRVYSVNMIAFCHWLEAEEIIEKPITTRFQLPKMAEKFIATYTPDDIQRLLAACETKIPRKPELSKAVTMRDRAIISVLVDSGIRRAELVGLRLGDVDRELRVLLVHRKGNKWQQVPISREGFKPLHEYLTKYRPYLARLDGKTKASKDDPVFLSSRGTPLTCEGVTQLFSRLKKRTGIDGKRVCAHNCRRYMATMQADMGRSPFDIQRQMGHTTLTMTNRYISQSPTRLQRSHELYSPLRLKPPDETGGKLGSGYYDE